MLIGLTISYTNCNSDINFDDNSFLINTMILGMILSKKF